MTHVEVVKRMGDVLMTNLPCVVFDTERYEFDYPDISLPGWAQFPPVVGMAASYWLTAWSMRPLIAAFTSGLSWIHEAISSP